MTMSQSINDLLDEYEYYCNLLGWQLTPEEMNNVHIAQDIYGKEGFKRWWQFWKSKTRREYVKTYRRDYKRGVVHVRKGSI